MSQTNTFITSSNEFVFYKKYVTISSSDRNVIKYPDQAQFSFELPAELTNVAAITLAAYNIPSDLKVFSIKNVNVTMYFTINIPNTTSDDEINIAIAECLAHDPAHIFSFQIEEGNYTPREMVVQLHRKFNSTVTIYIQHYFSANYPELLESFGGYDRFIVYYNSVSNKIWYGNICDGFNIVSSHIINASSSYHNCASVASPIGFEDWGLGYNLGFTPDEYESVCDANIEESANMALYNGVVVPRFFSSLDDDGGFWLRPDLNTFPNSVVYWIEPPNGIKLASAPHIYMELDKHNCIDELSPFSESAYTRETNATTGMVNSAFAKLLVPGQYTSQLIDKESRPYMLYYPALQRIQKINVKFRHHNGKLVDFGSYNYSFMLEFTLQSARHLVETNSRVFPPPMPR